ncbi:MAG: hypothetical protein HYR86_11370 [Candidatus Rokubacteria bacterium]|nr:hypothetical protein [Candidatus Rokubacteria bacterium]
MAHPVEHVRQQFGRTLTARLFVRHHMALIFAGTVSAGMIVSRIALRFGMRWMTLRYLLSITAAYLVFLVLVRLWVHYALRVIDLSREPAVARDADPVSRTRDDHTTPSAPARAPSWPVRVLGEAFGAALGEAMFYVAVFLLVVASLVVVAAYLVWHAPAILVEAAFEVWLAGTLLAQVRDVERRGWLTVTGARDDRAVPLRRRHVLDRRAVAAPRLPRRDDAASRARVLARSALTATPCPRTAS